MAKHSRITVMAGSGNVFADLGLAEPGEELAKAQLASLIGQVIKKRRLTQAAAAALMGVDQPKVSALLNGRIANFSSERLMRLLTALGRDIDIIVRRSSGRRVEGRIRVMEEAHPSRTGQGGLAHLTRSTERPWPPNGRPNTQAQRSSMLAMERPDDAAVGIRRRATEVTKR